MFSAEYELRQDMISFEVEGVGVFTARKELTLIEEALVDTEVNQLLNGEYFKILERVESLKEKGDSTSLKEANIYENRAYLCRSIVELSTVLVDKPDDFPEIKSLSDMELFNQVWDQYQKSREDLYIRKQKIYNYLDSLEHTDSDDEIRKKVREFEINEAQKNSRNLLFWFRKKYELPVTDYRVRSITHSQLLEEYLEHVVGVRTVDTTLVNGEKRVDTDFHEWADDLTSDESKFEEWAQQMEASLQLD